MTKVRSSPIHGRGAFATGAIRRGQMFHTADLLVFACEQSAAPAETAAANYAFHVDGCRDDPCREMIGGSPTVTFTAPGDIEAGEEITIDYGDFAAKLGID